MDALVWPEIFLCVFFHSRSPHSSLGLWGIQSFGSAEVPLTMQHAQGEQNLEMNSSDVHQDNYTPVLIEKKAQLPSYFHSHARQLLLTGRLAVGVVVGEVHT